MEHTSACMHTHIEHTRNIWIAPPASTAHLTFSFAPLDPLYRLRQCSLKAYAPSNQNKSPKNQKFVSPRVTPCKAVCRQKKKKHKKKLKIFFGASVKRSWPGTCCAVEGKAAHCLRSCARRAMQVRWSKTDFMKGLPLGIQTNENHKGEDNETRKTRRTHRAHLAGAGCPAGAAGCCCAPVAALPPPLPPPLPPASAA